MILISEVGYYWCREDLQKAQDIILEHLEPGGHLLLVHWLVYTPDYPLTGDEAHNSFLEFSSATLQHLQGQKNNKYRLDLFERV